MDKFRELNWATMGKLAFAAGFRPGVTDDDVFRTDRASSLALAVFGLSPVLLSDAAALGGVACCVASPRSSSLPCCRPLVDLRFACPVVDFV